MTPEARPRSGRSRPAHAKANLALAVTGQRADGYHELRSVVVRLALHDDLEVDAGDGEVDTLAIDGDPECPVQGNLVLRAAALVRARADRPLPGLAFRLRKRIPIAAGLGGGSSDAAAALDLAAAAWDIGLGPDERLDLASDLGADVPFFAGGHGAALVEGIGERLRALPAPHPPAGVLLVTPEARLSTARVFAIWDAGPGPGTGPSARIAVDRLGERLAAGMTGEELADDGERAAGRERPVAARRHPPATPRTAPRRPRGIARTAGPHDRFGVDPAGPLSFPSGGPACRDRPDSDPGWRASPALGSPPRPPTRRGRR